MFIEPAEANFACELLLWSLIPTQAGLANTRTVPKLGGGLRFFMSKNQSFCLIASMFIEPAGANCACGLLLWSLIPTQARTANTRTVPKLGGVLGAEC